MQKTDAPEYRCPYPEDHDGEPPMMSDLGMFGPKGAKFRRYGYTCGVSVPETTLARKRGTWMLWVRIDGSPLLQHSEGTYRQVWQTVRSLRFPGSPYSDYRVNRPGEPSAISTLVN
jgi:hypothetical protein